ncbi:MAG: glycosyltransferase 87 family protein [Acidimicrobiales bacterium]
MSVLWAIGAVSAGAVVFYAFLFAYARHEVDLDVYLLGGSNLFGGHLYAVHDANTHLPFTYPPFAALLFVPLSAIPEQAAELLLGAVNAIALAALVGVSLRALRPAWDRTRLLVWTLILMGPALAMDPVRLTFSFGQVNIILAALILADLTGMAKVGSKAIPTGILTGLTAAVKLIPLILVPYLFLIGRIRAMWVTLATFVAGGLGLALLAPHTSWLFWTKYVSDTNRVGSSAFISNQSLRAVIIRLHHANIPNSVFDLAALGFGLAGLGLARWAHRASSPLLGILVCATTGMVVSPITWVHHMVWVVPILLWLVLADDRPVGGWIWAAAAALVFWKAPIWLVPYNHGRELGENAWQLLLGNSFFWAMMVFLIGVAAMLAFRHPWGGNRVPGPTIDGRMDVRQREADPEPVSVLGGG